MFGSASGESITFNKNILKVVDKYYIHNILTGESELVDGEDEKKLKVILEKNIFLRKKSEIKTGKVCIWEIHLCSQKNERDLVVFASINPTSVLTNEADRNSFKEISAFKILQLRFSEYLKSL
jgi:broad-specificity NMP kinase